VSTGADTNAGASAGGSLSADLIKQAEYLHGLGLSLIPIKRGTKQAKGGWRDAQRGRRTLDRLRRELSADDVGGLAVVLGNVSGGLHCRDFDTADGYGRWAEQYPELAATLPTVKTPRGHHVYFMLHDEESTRKLGDGELRGRASYTLLPPSEHPEGGKYLTHGTLRFRKDKKIPRIHLSASGLDQYWSGETPLALGSETLPTSSRRSVDPVDPVDPIDPINQKPQTDQQILAACRVSGSGQHDKMTMKLARFCKFDARFITRETRRQLFEPWFRENQRHFTESDIEVCWVKFERAYKAAKLPVGAGGVAAQVLAKLATVPDVPELLPGRGEKLRRLACALAEMTRRNSGEPFKISANMVGRALGVSDQAAQAYFTALEDEGIIRVQDRGVAGTNGRGRARSVVYIGPTPVPADASGQQHPEASDGKETVLPNELVEFEELPEELRTDTFWRLWQEWRLHKRRQRDRLKPLTEQKQLDLLASKGHHRAVETVAFSLTNGYKGLIEPNANRRESAERQRQRHREREYSESNMKLPIWSPRRD